MNAMKTLSVLVVGLIPLSELAATWGISAWQQKEHLPTFQAFDLSTFQPTFPNLAMLYKKFHEHMIEIIIEMIEQIL